MREGGPVVLFFCLPRLLHYLQGEFFRLIFHPSPIDRPCRALHPSRRPEGASRRHVPFGLLWNAPRKNGVRPPRELGNAQAVLRCRDDRTLLRCCHGHHREFQVRLVETADEGVVSRVRLSEGRGGRMEADGPLGPELATVSTRERVGSVRIAAARERVGALRARHSHIRRNDVQGEGRGHDQGASVRSRPIVHRQQRQQFAPLPLEPPQIQDSWIMKDFIQLNCSPQELRQLNRVRMHQQVIFLSDVRDVSGRALVVIRVTCLFITIS